MKKFLLLISVIFFYIPANYAQVILEENFNYITGNLETVSGGKWSIVSPNYGYPIETVDGNLTYPGYCSEETGKLIFINSGTSMRSGMKRNLNTSLTSSVYISFLVSVRDNLDLSSPSTTGGTFFNLLDNYDSGKANLYIRNSTIPGCVNFGICKTGTASFSNADYNIMDSILILIKYKVVPGGSNDTVSLWINPVPTKSESVPDIKIGSGTDLSNIAALNFRQGSLAGNLFIDAVRVWTNWGDTPLPVELSSFTASLRNNKVSISWKTETEVDNYGFDVERRSNNEENEWKKLVFIPGNGNSNSPKYYSYEDAGINNLNSYSYRLKQMDNDGTFSYSDVIEVNVNLPEEFQLYQNYPNPFNPQTSIKFFIPENGFTSLNLYNAIGQKITGILNKYLPAGMHEVEFSGLSLNSGIYFCILESGGRRKSIKISLIK